MLTVNKRIAQSRGLAPALLRRAATIELDWDTRGKSRFDAVDSQGRTLGVFLPRGSVVRGGDALVAEDGSLVAVRAAPQPLLEVTACTEHGSAFDLVRAAYHLGNRHVALALAPDRLHLEPDPVLADMLRAMHLTVREVDAAFEPEAGAYAHGAAPPGRAVMPPVVAAVAPHVHGPGCGHDHGHGHGHGHGSDQGHAHRHDHGSGPDPAHGHGPGDGHRPADRSARQHGIDEGP